MAAYMLLATMFMDFLVFAWAPEGYSCVRRSTRPCDAKDQEVCEKFVKNWNNALDSMSRRCCPRIDHPTSLDMKANSQMEFF